uniref:Uncharacterized protein n=1 Tax=Chromera velia CCMP2878 TaxID=1169474 RepID=A0A0G4HCQ5_9ALVE|eukprot:Cvel_6292.t1-p1 / transcript=Cvel_6292.t1 / gene=Cvel_6292 / organism=Chromera_velia_CCMP2878 / gene_product=hypothetical protein / transcript_product=hypothetical protein / location=Cvel_scaffold305:58422-60398(+) / protein_length=188 / sequence_SO=supercontig / SO=protein_coding / is_pseudo=false
MRLQLVLVGCIAALSSFALATHHHHSHSSHSSHKNDRQHGHGGNTLQVEVTPHGDARVENSPSEHRHHHHHHTAVPDVSSSHGSSGRFIPSSKVSQASLEREKALEEKQNGQRSLLQTGVKSKFFGGDDDEDKDCSTCTKLYFQMWEDDPIGDDFVGRTLGPQKEDPAIGQGCAGFAVDDIGTVARQS